VTPLPSLLPPLALALVLVPARVGGVHPPTGSASPPVDAAAEEDDQQLLRISGLGRFGEVLWQGRARLQTGPRPCLLVELTANSAERRGQLPALIEELQDARNHDPQDAVLLFAQALALQVDGY
jgi:hypothetical protein